MSFRIDDKEYSADDADEYKARVQQALRQVVGARRTFCGCIHLPARAAVNQTEAAQVDQQLEEIGHNDVGDTLTQIRIRIFALGLYLENDGGVVVNQQLKANCFILSGAVYNHKEHQVTTNEQTYQFIEANKAAIVQAAFALHAENRASTNASADDYTAILEKRFNISHEVVVASPMKTTEIPDMIPTSYGKSLL